MRLKLAFFIQLLLLLYIKGNCQSGVDSLHNNLISASSPAMADSFKKDFFKSSTAKHDSLPSIERVKKEKDFEDVVRHIFDRSLVSPEGPQIKDTRKHFSWVPAAGYTLQTGFAALISGNMAFYTDTAREQKLSNVSTNVTYSQYNQTIIPFLANIWTKGNHYNFITDFRFIDYPSAIYGLGGRTDPNKGHTIDFSGIKFHQTIMRALSENLYVGIGYFYDHFYKIKALDSATRNINQRITKELGGKETGSGIAFRLLYDSRLNQINPKQGAYYNITYRTSEKSLGSDSTWQSLQIDARTYFPFPKKSENVLAFWMFDWLTANGTPPYLLLPSVGWDDNYNTGRGYIQGRFRGRNMLYFESEYRFKISHNGLIGGVVFTNLENYSSDLSAQYNKLFLGYGAGLRIKLNKYSGTNLCIDYGIGKNGSRGFFVNLGEVF